MSPRHQAPVAAIWVAAALTLASTLSAPAYATLTSACVILLYLSYVDAARRRVLRHRPQLDPHGPFDLGRSAYRALAAAATLGVLLVIWIGVQPPNERALIVTGATLAVLAAGWWLRIRKTFRGPPNLTKNR